MFEYFEHTADIGLRMHSSSFEELLVDAARGLFSLFCANLEEVRPVEHRQFTVTGDDPEYLLFDWLTELLYVFDTERLLLSQFVVRRTPEGLEAEAGGEPLDPARHQLEHEVKAITYHGLQVRHDQDRWSAEVIVDI